MVLIVDPVSEGPGWKEVESVYPWPWVCFDRYLTPQGSSGREWSVTCDRG